eukprot:960472-Amorphochlora_amoeboformis.AAC.1
MSAKGSRRSARQKFLQPSLDEDDGRGRSRSMNRRCELSSRIFLEIFCSLFRSGGGRVNISVFPSRNWASSEYTRLE